MKTKIFTSTTIIILILITSISLESCVNKKFDTPKKNCDDTISTNATIAQLKSLYSGSTEYEKITKNITIEGYIISSDKHGNFYKEIVIQDKTDAITIMIDLRNTYTTYPEGTKMYVKCKDLYLGNYHGTIKLGALYKENGYNNFGRIQGTVKITEKLIPTCDNKKIEPKIITIPITTDIDINKLVKIENVQFRTNHKIPTWADATNQKTINQYIVNPDGKTLIVRNSGYSTFASDTLPKGNGSIIGILSKYDNDYQLIVRDKTDAQMINPKIPETYIKNFNDDDLYSFGWTCFVVKGKNWKVKKHGTEYFAQCSSYDGSGNPHIETEAWLISPNLDLTKFNNPIIKFKTAWGYNGTSTFTVKYSTNYNGKENPNNATWTELNPTIYSGTNWFTWTDSGELNIPKEKLYIAFVYIGGKTDGNTWEVDDIEIKDKK